MKRGKCPYREKSDVGCARKKVTLALKSFIGFFAVEADEERKESETTRGLSDEEKKDKPSEIMSALDKGLSAMADIVTDEVNV